MKFLSHRISSLTLSAVFGFFMTNSAMAEKSQDIYKWVDKDGRVHYAARPGDKSAKKMHLGSKIFHSQKEEDEKKAKQTAQDKERAKLCQDSRDTLEKYKKAPFLYRYDTERKQKVRLTESESKEAFLQAEKDISYWCNPAEQSAKADTETKTEAEAEVEPETETEEKTN